MDIKVLGMGCMKCKKLYESTEKAVKELVADATIGKIENMEDIMKYGVMSTPALVIDGKVKVTGKVPSVKEIKKLIEAAL